MDYGALVQGIFLKRPNRFLAQVLIGDSIEICHVKNTGRLKELLCEGAVVYLKPSMDPNRKTKFSLIAVEKEGRVINIDSQAPNRAVQEWLAEGQLFPEVRILKPESRYGESRFDFYIETPSRKAFMEVKGVTLIKGGGAFFPDAPTERGVKHIQELCKAKKEGYDAYLLFVIQLAGVKFFSPNRERHPAFGEALDEADQMGVAILAYDCAVTPGTMKLRSPVEVRLSPPEP